jgi:transposase InsO family protein
MPWKETCVMDERVRFIGRYLDGEKTTDLIREFGISRKTAYKFIERYEKYGLYGLSSRSRRPLFSPNKTADEVEDKILELKKIQPSWGPKKLKAKLEGKNPGIVFPAASTIGSILDKHGLVQKRKRRRWEEKYYPTALQAGSKPNEVWCTDFKGQFKLGNKQYCYPLTVSDLFSRCILGCEALSNTTTDPVMGSFEAFFDEYGLPSIIRSDNGPPFASQGFGGLSVLSAWWMRLGIKPERIEPGCPQQNGQHERMHLTLKLETTRPPKANLLQQQESFDDFKDLFNNERPHEALAMKTPASLYKPSLRKYSDALRELDYPLHDFTLKVKRPGVIRIAHRKDCYLTAALIGHTLGLRELEEGVLLVSLGKFDLGYIDSKSNRFLADNPLSEEETLC